MKLKKQIGETFTGYYQRVYDEYHHQLWKYADILDNLSCEIEKIEISENSIWAKIKKRDLWVPLLRDDFGTSALASLNNNGYEKQDAIAINSCMKYIISKKSAANIIFMDIGANIGWYSLIAMSKYSKIRVHSFEPNSIARNLLKSALKRNNFSERGIVNESAVMNESGTIDFKIAKLSGASGISENLENQEYETIKVPTTTLDEYCKNKGIHPDLIKIDAEGAELFILEGGHKILNSEETKPIIFCELLRKWSYNNGYHPNKVINLMQKYGYNCYAPNESKRLDRLAYIDDNTINTNFLFIDSNISIKEVARFIETEQHDIH